MLRTFLVVGVGSFLGGGCRFLMSKFVQHYAAYSFPTGTFVVNLLGCLLIGILYGLFEKGNIMNADLRIFLTVGFCGGFTTFSTFVNENFQLLKDSNYFYMSIYMAFSLFGGLLALYMGHLIIKAF